MSEYAVKISEFRYAIIDAEGYLDAAKKAVFEYGLKPNYDQNNYEVYLLENPKIFNIDYSLKFVEV